MYIYISAYYILYIFTHLYIIYLHIYILCLLPAISVAVWTQVLSSQQLELPPKMSSPRSGRHAFHGPYGPYGPGARAIAVHGPLVVQGHRCSVILTEEQWESFIQTGKLKKQWFGNGKSIPVKDSLNQKNTHKKIKNQTTNKQQHNKKQKLKQNSKHKQTTNTTTNKNTQQTKHKPRHMHIP